MGDTSISGVGPQYTDLQPAEADSKTLLRFLACGAVDDGKSTLLGRLLYDCKLLYEDQIVELENDSARFGTTGAGNLDFALLVDGLSSEREQGITIDVAYRYFSTARRKFIIADTPGHADYTRNMVTGASTADLAVLVVDARKGLVTQTRRHSYLISLLGVNHVVLAVNKMDLMEWRETVFNEIADEYRAYADKIGIPNVTCIPVSALSGDNISAPSSAMPWYSGPTLLQHLESVDVDQDAPAGGFRFPVQLVSRPHLDFRGYAGTVASGDIRVGDPVVVLPSGKETTIARIVTMDGDLEAATAGQAITLVVADNLDISRGDVLVAPDRLPQFADQFAAHVVWMYENQLLPGRSYLLLMGETFVNAQVTELKYKVNVDTLEHIAAKHLELNDIASCNLALDRAIPFDGYADNRTMGGFIIIDKMSNATVGCGMIDFALRRATNIHHHDMAVDASIRAKAKGQTACVLWLTGLSGAGKSTLADIVEQRLHALGRHTMLLDGDNIRFGLNRDLGFSDEDRVENIRRIAEVSKLMVDAGLITMVSFISPFRSERDMARKLVGEGRFFEIFVDVPIEVCEARDPKGLYKKARSGEIPNFTGINSPYEPPEHPDLVLRSAERTKEKLADEVIAMLENAGII